MSEKSYLQNQINLVSLSARDTFTEEENAQYKKIIDFINEIDKLDGSDDQQDAFRKNELILEKKKAVEELNAMIAAHKGPRQVRLSEVIFHQDSEEIPPGVTWKNMKYSKQIAEFESEMSRAMGLKPNDYTFDKIVIKWGGKRHNKSNENFDVLRQLVMDGFTMDIIEGNRVITKKYRCFTASAGQIGL